MLIEHLIESIVVFLDKLGVHRWNSYVLAGYTLCNLVRKVNPLVLVNHHVHVCIAVPKNLLNDGQQLSVSDGPIFGIFVFILFTVINIPLSEGVHHICHTFRVSAFKTLVNIHIRLLVAIIAIIFHGPKGAHTVFRHMNKMIYQNYNN